MKIKDHWFNLNFEDDHLIINDFISNLERNFQALLFNESTTNFLQVNIISNNSLLSREKFQAVFDEAVSNLSSIERKYNLDEDIYINLNFKDVRNQVREIGWTGESLRFKGALLNELWSKIIKAVDKNGDRLINFANNEIVKLVRKFLTYLNSLLGSLSTVLPGIEAVKEFKDIAESFISIGED